MNNRVKKIFLLIFAITAALLTAVFVFLYQKNSRSNDIDFIKGEAELVNGPVQKNTVIESETKQSHTTGLIVPHFAPVSNLTVDALDHVSTTPDLIILIGPNHHEAGNSPVITGSYISSKLLVHPIFATDKMYTLAQMHVATYEDAVISLDHSMGTPLPFIVQKFPNVPVLPIVLKYHQNPENIEHLVAALQNISSPNTLIVASVDFSHYLPSDITPQKDADTQTYIASHDYAHIAALSNDYIDSPWSLITFLKYLDAAGVRDGKLLAHTNTGKVIGETIESSTSFFTYIY